MKILAGLLKVRCEQHGKCTVTYADHISGPVSRRYTSFPGSSHLYCCNPVCHDSYRSRSARSRNRTSGKGKLPTELQHTPNMLAIITFMTKTCNIIPTGDKIGKPIIYIIKID